MSKMQYYCMILFFFNFLIINIYAFESNNPQNAINNTNDEEDEDWFWNKEDYPNPYEKPPYCRRTKPSFVCNPDEIISKKEANRLDELIKGVTNVSVCFCSYCPPNKRGISIGIALIKRIFKEYNVQEFTNAQNFADFVRKRWNFGVCDNNMVILLVASDDQIAVSQGSTTQKVFPQFAIEETIMNNKIHFINGDYFHGLESIIKSYGHLLKNNLQYSPSFNDKSNENSNENSSNAGVIVGLIIGFVVVISFVLFILLYVRKRFSEDNSQFQFKGMLSKGYWLNKNERLRPVSVNPINTVGGVYEPCSIEEANDNDVDKRLRQKLSQISEGSSCSDEEEIEVIEENSDHQTKPMNDKTNSSIEHTSVNVEPDHNRPIPTVRNNNNTNDKINV